MEIQKSASLSSLCHASFASIESKQRSIPMLSRSQLLWVFCPALACCLAYAFLATSSSFQVLQQQHQRSTPQVVPVTPPSVESERVFSSSTRPAQPSPSQAAKLSAVIQNPTSKHTATVIFLHGFGDSGAGWAPVGEQLSEYLPHVKFIFPNAPPLPITVNGGMLTPAWYDILSLKMDNHRQDEKGMMQSRQQVMQIVRDEVEQSNIPANRIIIGGFSQGCVLGLLTALTSEYRFAGIVSLSGYMPMSDKIMTMAADANRKTPIFWGHGTVDQVIKYEFGEQSVEFLQKNKYEVEFHSYRMGHNASPEEVRDLLNFFKATIPEELPIMAKA